MWSIAQDIHLVVENLGLAGLGLWNQRLIQNVENILANFLEFGLDLLAILADGTNVLIGTLGLFLLLDGRDDSPRSTSCAYDILVCNGEQIALIDGKLTTQLLRVSVFIFMP